MPDITTTEWVAIVGWAVTFALGILATLVTQRMGRTRKRISWSLVNESNFLSQKVLEGITAEFRVPIQIMVDGTPQTDLSTIRVKLANTGNAEVENITLHFRFGESARVHVGRYLGELGAYRQSLHLEKNRDLASLSIQHINPKQAFEVEFLVGGYQAGDFEVDLAAPGVTLHRTDLATLETSKHLLKAVSYGVMGIKYDPVATQVAALVEEVRRLRKVAERKTSTDES